MSDITMKDAFDIVTYKICFSLLRLHLVSLEYKEPLAGPRAPYILRKLGGAL